MELRDVIGISESRKPTTGPTDDRSPRSGNLALASPPADADAHARDESVARGWWWTRGCTARKRCGVQAGRAGTGRVVAGTLGKPTPAGPARSTYSTGSRRGSIPPPSFSRIR